MPFPLPLEAYDAFEIVLPQNAEHFVGGKLSIAKETIRIRMAGGRHRDAVLDVNVSDHGAYLLPRLQWTFATHFPCVVRVPNDIDRTSESFLQPQATLAATETGVGF